MITDNDLLDLGACFKSIRMDISSKKNITIVEKILSVLKSSTPNFTDNQFRRALAKIKHLNKEKWWFIYHNNVYVAQRVIKDQVIYSIFIHSCEELISILRNQEYERADNLIDALHCLPEIIFDNNLLVIQTYWNSHMAIYRDKWDQNFLINEQQETNRCYSLNKQKLDID